MTTELRSAADFPGCAVLDTAIRRLVAAGDSSGLFFDFDGVLSVIQDDPDSVQPTEGVREALEAISDVVGVVALVSSRNAEFLYSRLSGVPKLGMYGLYGLECIAGDGTVEVVPEAKPWITVVREVYETAVRELPEVRVEDKRLSLGLHYRYAPHVRPAIEEWAGSAASRTGLKVQHGRMVVELKPPIETDKGTVVARLSESLDTAWFFGDDLGDLPAFVALHRRAELDDEFHGLAIGVGNDTIVDEVRAQSDVFLTSPLVLVDLLRHVHAAFTETA